MLNLITTEEYDVELEIAYASSNNFMQKPIYKNTYCYLHPDAAAALIRANNLAKSLGLRLKIFDAFRPLEAQWALWNHTPDPNFVSHPETGLTTHCRGVAVDLTLVDADKKELDMGTEFDAFTPLSFHSCTEISTEAQQNRFILLGIMTAAGWDFFKNEWWHYQLHNPRNYPKISDLEANTQMM
jgi:D-alanyl-D-alanine dipeptidase